MLREIGTFNDVKLATWNHLDALTTNKWSEPETQKYKLCCALTVQIPCVSLAPWMLIYVNIFVLNLLRLRCWHFGPKSPWFFAGTVLGTII